jgi:hypothetical protein
MDIGSLTSNPLFNLFNGVIGILGVALAVYFYWKGRERFTLRYQVIERTIIERKLERRPFDLDGPITWGGVEVSERLLRSFILVQNSGNKLFEKSDLIETPLMQTSFDAKILDAKMVSCDDAGSQPLVVSIRDNLVSFSFEFLRPSEGIVLRVDHTGKPNELFVVCRTKQGGPIKKQGPAGALAFVLAALVLAPIIGSYIWPYLDEGFYKSVSKDAPWLAFGLCFSLGLASEFIAVGAVLLASVLYLLAMRKWRTLTASETFICLVLNLRGASV